MNVNMVITLEWDKSKESLDKFREKYESMKSHVQRLQLKGHLPISDIRWSLTTAKKEVLALGPPVVEHKAGEVLA